MNFKSIQSYFLFTNSQKKGLLLLFAIIIGLQIFTWRMNNNPTVTIDPEAQKWFLVQSELDSLKKNKKNYVAKIYPFNPNFISDYKGYKLGMTVAQIDRLHAYRKLNKYVNSAQEFQAITKVSDSLLTHISPYFKFPDWVKNKKEYSSFSSKYDYKSFPKKEKIAIIDINQASQQDLEKISGIGPVTAIRILNYKQRLGCFVSMEQMNEIWGLSPEIILELQKYFKLGSTIGIKKVDINNASIKELSEFPYFNYQLARKIVTFRSMNGDFKDAQDLTKIKELSIEKTAIIALYLTF